MSSCKENSKHEWFPDILQLSNISLGIALCKYVNARVLTAQHILEEVKVNQF